MKFYNLSKGTILTYDDEYSKSILDEENNKYDIKIIPIWKWMLIEKL